VLVDCQVDQSLDGLLREDFNLTSDDLRQIEAVILDGNSVDDPTSAVVRDGCRLALAAGLPGVAGMALKKNSPLKGLRNSITLREDQLPATSRPGRICLALYSLVLNTLGARFLRRGVWITRRQLTRYAAFNLTDQISSGQDRLTVAEFLEGATKEPRELYYLSAVA
jgi:hypothetical protein